MTGKKKEIKEKKAVEGRVRKKKDVEKTRIEVNADGRKRAVPP